MSSPRPHSHFHGFGTGKQLAFGTATGPSRSSGMIYIAAPLIVMGMLGYMAWLAIARMRRDRVYNERDATRGRHAFTRFHRAKYLLARAFRPEAEEPRWQTELRKSLDQARERRGDGR